MVLAGACSGSEIPATQVIVSVNSDLDVRDELASVVIYVLDPDSDKVVAQHPFELTDRDPRGEEVRLPFSFGLRKGQKSRFRLDVVGYAPTGAGGAEEAVVEQKVLGTFRDRETLLLEVFLSRACYMRLCEQGDRTCYPEPNDGIGAGECGDVLEPELTPTRAGDEHDGWSRTPTGTGGKDGGVADSGSDAGDSGTAGRAGTSGRAGRGGAAGADTAGAGGGEAGEGGQAGETGDAGEGGAGEGSAGEGTAGSGTAGSSGAGAGGAGSGGSGGTPACVPKGVKMWDSEGADHVEEMGGSMTVPSDYDSDPPSSGLHCNAWTQYMTFPPDKPAPLCNWVHALEHGAVVLLYNCPEPCPEIVAGLQQVIDDSPPDPNCSSLDPPIKRLVLTPYSGMTAKFAASTWQYTWTSNCDTFTAADREALLDFIDDHWGSRGLSGEKSYCNNGSVTP